MNSIGMYRVPYDNNGCYQFVAPIGYHFMRGSVNYGRIAWFSNVDGITIEKDET